MAKVGVSARGELVDFDLLAIKQQLSSKPISVGVNDRRTFIDIKDGIKPKVQNAIQSTILEQPVEQQPVIDEMFAASAEAATQSSVKTKK
jgi:hypothetical protein